jgi:hypothetical protein
MSGTDDQAVAVARAKAASARSMSRSLVRQLET